MLRAHLPKTGSNEPNTPKETTLQDAVLNIFVRQGTIARPVNLVIEELCREHNFTTHPHGKAVFCAPYIKYYSNSSHGHTMTFNPSHNDVCRQKFPKKCNNPNCRKLHRNIKYSLYSQTARFHSYQRLPSPNEKKYTTFYEWNHKKKSMELHFPENTDPRI